ASSGGLSCGGRDTTADTHPSEDVATSSSFRQFKIDHFHLDLKVDFEQKTISGTETIQLQCIQDGQSELQLDIHPTLSVHEITFKSAILVHIWVPCPEPQPVSRLPYAHDKEHLLGCCAGNVSPNARIFLQVCWLEPEQTAGKLKPYVFTQGQAVLNRSFFPCFDTPGVKSTYSATVQVPDGFTAVMSASKWEQMEADSTFLFTMEHPIPAYLVALAVGDLRSAEVGPRTRVWTEPCLLQAAKQEYGNVIEEFLSVGEKLFGPYVWGRYDVLFMPPSFPFGGMENPCLTFVTPCLLAGDRSLADVIVHEICHSWFGNLVTNATWGDFWLNEGFTMYAQRRVCRELYGEAYTCLEAATGKALLRQHMDNTGEDHPLNKLRVKIEPGVDPDDTYNDTPYEKGFCFVSYLAHLAGDQSRFDAFLKDYVDKFKFRSVLAEDALEFYLEYFPDLKEKNVHKIDGLDFDSWLNVPGWPPYVPDLSAGQELMKPAELLAEMWVNHNPDLESICKTDIKPWKTYQTVYFLDKILEKSPLPDGHIKKLEECYSYIIESNNAELKLRWAQIVAKNQHKPGFQHIRNFLTSQGKQKYTLPVYRALWNGSEETKTLAMEVFSATSKQLHFNVRNYVKKIIA
uniref:Aminopeptidase B-like n=1 Tax=Sinocyclocheilus grahami TaxID=75366 RepID=A0A672SVK4_SINGR